MNNFSRHIACKLCRDRKVRCDGGQPSCDKCRRSGELCIYVPTHKPTKADLTQTIESLQERLDKAEAYILRHSNTNISASLPLPSTTPTSALSVDYPDCSYFDLSASATVPAPALGGHSFPPAHGVLPSIPYSQHHHHHHQQTPISPQNTDGEFINYAASPQPLDAAHYLDNDPRRLDDVSGAARRDSATEHHRRIPSRHQVRIASDAASSTTPPSSASPSRRGQRAEDANHILAEFTAFGMAVFNTQAEIAGVSSVVAGYLEWMRKALEMNEQGQGLEAPSKANLAMLVSLQMRVLEINAMARARHLDAWRQSVARLERIPGVGAMMGLFDNEMVRRSAETAKFFQSSYNVCESLTEQTAQIPE